MYIFNKSFCKSGPKSNREVLIFVRGYCDLDRENSPWSRTLIKSVVAIKNKRGRLIKVKKFDDQKMNFDL